MMIPFARLFIKPLLLALIGCLFSVAVNAETEPSLLHVRGAAQLQVAPDQVVVVLGVISEEKTAKKALAANSEAMNKVVKALYGLGLTKKEVVTQRFGVQPVWSSRPRNVDSSWRSEIVGYRVNNSVAITTQQLDLAGDIIAAATTAGANEVQSVSFGLANPRDYRSEAIKQAVTNAREDADTAVAAANARIKKIHTMHLDQAVASVAQVEKAVLMRSAMADAAPEPPPINAGNITVRASVSISYELE